jgi:hypothetical protein
MTDSDRHLDDDLRRIPLPGNLRAAIAPEALFADAAIDRLLEAVPVPPSLADRVRSAARSNDRRGSDGVVDLMRFAKLAGDRSPATPPRTTAAFRRRVRGLVGLAREAGRVAAAIGLVAVVAIASREASRRLEGPAASVAADRAASGWAVPNDRRIEPVDDAIALRQNAGRSLVPPEPAEPRIPRLAAAGQDDSTSPTGTWDAAGVADIGPARDGAAGLAPERSPPASPPRVRGAAILSAERDRPPVLTVTAAPGDIRRLVPKSAAFDLAFEMAHGESPFVNPAADPALAVDRPPLSLRTDGFELLTRPGTGRPPSSLRERIRAEEVLAAMPAPESLLAGGDDGMRLGVFAVRSGRAVGGKPTLLLEAAAFAAGRPPCRDRPLEVALILDQAATGDPRAWPRICRGVAAVAGQLGPSDRVSVVLCGPRPRVALRAADAAELAAAAMNWEALPAAGSSDLDAAIEAADAAGLLDRRTVIVAHANTLDRGRGGVRELLASWHRGLALADGDQASSPAAAGPRFVILDPATPAADDGPTFGRTRPDAVAIRREMVRQVTGDDTLVARRCRLEVRFDPGRVAAYRLVGHRQSVVESLATDEPPPVDLHAGETVRAVYEVVPRDATRLGLATATVTWRAADGTMARLQAADRDAGDRAAALPSPHGCELLLAATLGEIAGGSVHLLQPGDALAAVAAVAADWQARGDLTAFGGLLVREVERRTSGSRAGHQR